ncbi:MAG: carbon storage regulator [Thermoguttaceae bacterium]|jgi:carbon storage regulator
MLVLTRKIGQQIVLPGYGVTIDVVGVTKSQVRLGIEAPSGVPVYRREILDRIRCQRESRHGGKGELEDQVTALADEPASANTAGTAPPDLDQCLAKWVAHRTSGRIRRLSVKTIGGRTMITGSATSYYARQLAQAAVKEVFDNWSSRPLPNVQYEIDIVDRTFVSRTGGSLSFSSHVGNGHTG